MALSLAVAAKTLGISRLAPLDEARAAYRGLIVKAHPDKGGSPEEFRGIQLAWEVYSKHRSLRGVPRGAAKGSSTKAKAGASSTKKDTAAKSKSDGSKKSQRAREDPLMARMAEDSSRFSAAVGPLITAARARSSGSQGSSSYSQWHWTALRDRAKQAMVERAAAAAAAAEAKAKSSSGATRRAEAGPPPTSKNNTSDRKDKEEQTEQVKDLAQVQARRKPEKRAREAGSPEPSDSSGSESFADCDLDPMLKRAEGAAPALAAPCSLQELRQVLQEVRKRHGVERRDFVRSLHPDLARQVKQLRLGSRLQQASGRRRRVRVVQENASADSCQDAELGKDEPGLGGQLGVEELTQARRQEEQRQGSPRTAAATRATPSASPSPKTQSAVGSNLGLEASFVQQDKTEEAQALRAQILAVQDEGQRKALLAAAPPELRAALKQLCLNAAATKRKKAKKAPGQRRAAMGKPAAEAAATPAPAAAAVGGTAATAAAAAAAAAGP